MILALELGRDRARAHALDDAGTIQTARVRPLSSTSTPAQTWLQLIELAREASASVALEPAQWARIALVFPGELDALGRVKTNDEGFANYDLRRGLREHLQLETTEILVASAGVADAWAQANAGALRDCDSWIYLSIGQQLESVACVRGAWLQSDLGALVLQRDGALDHRGRKGTLAAYCAGLAFAERARSYSLNVAAREIWALAPSNFAAQSLARDYVSRLAQGLSSAVAALCPRRICIGGALGGEIFPLICHDLASELRDYTGADAWNGAIVSSAPGSSHVESIAPGALTLATLGASPLG